MPCCENGVKEIPFEKVINLITKMTNNNNIGDALITGAKYFGTPDLLEKLKLINQLILLEVPHSGLWLYRDELFYQLLNQAENKLTKEEYALFNNAF